MIYLTFNPFVCREIVRNTDGEWMEKSVELIGMTIRKKGLV